MAVREHFLNQSHQPVTSRRLLIDEENQTRSPMAKLRRWEVHFCLDWRVGKYSFIHLFQNEFARHCAWRQCLLYMLWLVKTSKGRQELDLRGWSLLGVSISGSSGWSLTGVKGLSLSIFSTSHSRVNKVSSLTSRSFNKAPRILRTERIIRSQTPPWWLASGGLNRIAMTRYECSVRLRWNQSSRLYHVWGTRARFRSGNLTSQRPQQLSAQGEVWKPL